jgi:hypothetical protein
MNMKKTHLILFALFSFSLLFSLPDRVNAEFRAANGNGNIDIVCGSSGCGSDSNKLQLVGYSGNLGISVSSRPFNFIRSDNGGALNYGNNIPVETKLNFSPYGNASGSWWVSGGGYDTPDMGSGENLIPGARTKNGNGRIDVKSPITSNPISIVGNGAVSCDGWTCTAHSTGKAWIDVIFPGNSVEATSAPKYPDQDSRCSQIQQQCTTNSVGGGVVTGVVKCYDSGICDTIQPGTLPICRNSSSVDCYCPNGDRFDWSQRSTGNRNQGFTGFVTTKRCISQPRQQQVCNNVQVSGDDCGQDSERISYSNQNITINFDVIADPNQAPTVDYTNTTNISYNTAKANWTYTDPENDPIINSQLQIATDQAFTNLVVNQSQKNSSTSMNVSGLRPGTTYYPRVAAKDAKGTWSAWNNVPAFTTLANPVPNLADFSCGVSKITDSPAKYTTAKVNWNYTGSDSDRLILNLRYKKVSSNLFTSNNLTSSKTGTIDQSGLEAGSTYNVQISITDEFNRHITSQIKNCGDITLEAYPTPQVEFSLSNHNRTSTAKKGEVLTIGQSDGVSASWNITNTFSLIDNSCEISNTPISGGVNAQIFNQTSLGFSISNLLGQNIPTVPQDLEYKINLKCEGKNANPKKEVNEDITLRIVSMPTVSCSLDKRAVSSVDSKVQLTANVGNVSGYYNIAIGRNTGETNYTDRITSITNNQSVVNQSLDYTNLPFGRYRPWIEIISNTGKKVSANCSFITNFGDTQVKEVNP